MLNTPKWLAEFRLSADQVQQWEASLPKEKSLIVWCFENGKLSPDLFLSWARKHYQLPVLSESFSDFSTVTEIANRYSSSLWPEHVTPIAEWDGVLFLGCLEPVDNLKAPQKIQWVLLSYPMFKKLRGGENVSVGPIGEAGGPMGLSLEGLADLEKPEVASATTGMPEAPAGLSLDGPIGLDFGNLGINKSTEGSTSTDQPGWEPPTGLFAAPPELQHPEPATRVIEMPVVPNFEPSIPQPPPLNVQPPPLNIQPPPIVTAAPTPPPLTQTQPPPVPRAAPTPPPMAAQPQPIVAQPPPIQKPVVAVAPPPIPASTPPTSIGTLAPQGKMMESAVASFEDVGHFLLGEMGGLFDKSMVLLFNGDRLEPWKWSAGWKVDSSKSRAIDLSSPSVFRIVSTSNNSYHGHIVPNVINDAFFQTWNQGHYPEHLTIVPIPISKNLLGMVLGTCTKARAQGFNLKAVEAIGEKAAGLLTKWRPTKAA